MQPIGGRSAGERDSRSKEVESLVTDHVLLIIILVVVGILLGMTILGRR